MHYIMKTISLLDRRLILSSINSFLKDINYTRTSVEDLVLTENSIYSNDFNDIIGDCFVSFSKSVKLEAGTYYHYKSFSRAFEIIRSGKFLASALSNYKKDTEDVMEFEYLFKMLQRKNQDYVDKEKENNYIFCLTSDNVNNKFFEEYTLVLLNIPVYVLFFSLLIR